MADVTPYTGLVTSEHNTKAKFMAVISALVQPCADIVAALNSFPALFDIDKATGQQLDYIGQWVGRTRNLKVPITGVFFSLDVAPGLDYGVVWTPYTPTAGLQSLPDDQYRLVLKARILNNQWNGSLSQAYAIYNALFVSSNYVPFVEDNSDLTMYVGFAGQIPDALTLAMLTQGLLNARPAGVQVIGYYTTSANGPIFALDIENANFAGLDVGAVAILNAPT